jgi:hypothetical protein
VWILIGAILIGAHLHAQFPMHFSRLSPSPAPAATVPPVEGAAVLFLGDSLSLCGFGKRFDDRLRHMPGVRAMFTYMACATQPLSWLKTSPYTNVKTRCGFWSIESTNNPLQPRENEDVYGMRRGWVPKAHPVPKLDDLLAQIQPDVLIMQTGGNLFDLFPDHKTVRPERDGRELKKFVAPFVLKTITPPSSLKKIYWVASPVSGRVSSQVQDFVLQQVRSYFGPAATVIDSRMLITYPYRHMERDKEHFIGQEMDTWADKVSDIVRQDISSTQIASLKPLSENFPQVANALQSSPAPAPTAENRELELLAKLVFKSKPMQVEEFLPYQESLVGYIYEVRKVVAGHYDEQQILVMHPAYIGLKKQSLRKYRIGKTYRLRLHEFDKTPWSTVKRRDESGRIDLEPYIKVEDETKYPGAARAD